MYSSDAAKKSTTQSTQMGEPLKYAKTSANMKPEHTTAPLPALAPGSRIRLIAPAGPFDVGDFHRGVEQLRERYEVVFDEGVTDRHGYLAGDDARRSRELLQALDDADARALVAVRGGYGTTRLLSLLDTATIQKSSKLLVGFSDITALHAQWYRAGLRSVHGSMVAALGRTPEADFNRWCKHLEGEELPTLRGLVTLQGGRAQGPLMGGNLAVLCALLGTPYAPDPSGAVLFLEDVGERCYRVDRMLTTLKQAGWFAKAAGVLLGDFHECRPGSDGVTIEEVLRERLADVGIPVAAGAPVGHGDANHELPLGAPVDFDASAGNVTFLEGAVYN